jgi:hypothetical protein
MEHHEAVRSRAAERYVARELPPAERDAFEQHFFDCPECAQEVQFEQAFAANLRAVLREGLDRSQPVVAGPGFWRKWRQWIRVRPVAAFSLGGNIVMAAVLGYVVLAGARHTSAPRFTHPYFAPGPTHGAEDVHAIPTGETLYVVRFPSAGAGAQSYSYEILNAAGQREASASLKAPAGQDDSLYLEVQLDSLSAGVHTLIIRGGSGGEIVSWSKFQTSR